MIRIIPLSVVHRPCLLAMACLDCQLESKPEALFMRLFGVQVLKGRPQPICHLAKLLWNYLLYPVSHGISIL